MTDKEKAKEIAIRSGCLSDFPHHELSEEHGALKMAEWKDQQFIETAQEDAESYVKGVAKANPDLSEFVLNLLETAYIARRNRIK